MATTARSSITRLLRAAVSHRTATTLLRPHQNLHLHHPISTLTSFPHSNIRTSSLRFFSTARSVRTRATKLSPHTIWAYLKNLGWIVMGGLMAMFLRWSRIKVVGLLGHSDEEGVWFQGSLPNFFRKDHSIVVEGLVKPIVATKGHEYYLSATEVLAYKPEEISAAMERNKEVIAVEERNAVLTWYTTLSDEILRSGPDPSKSESGPGGVFLEGRVKQSTLSPKVESYITKFLNAVLVEFPGLRDELREGHSFVIKGFDRMITDEIKEEKSDEINEEKLGNSVTVKTRGRECHFSAQVLAKHNEKYMPQEVVAEVLAKDNEKYMPPEVVIAAASEE